MANSEIDQSVVYLKSEQAIRTVTADPYWPKWNSPWWHMLLLHEMGETQRIPSRLIESFVEALNRIPLKVFPIYPGEMPDGLDPFRGSPCHCQLGNVYQVLARWGVDVDQELPWIRPWFLRYQMADGGLNCDNDAYLVKDEVPSSMVGTIAPFEAVVLYTPREWTPAEKTFVAKGAQFLIQRKLRLGSGTRYNADERLSAESWPKLCFPRFYLYDTLRGLTALLAWAEKTHQPIPSDAVREVVSDLSQRFPDGEVRIERQSYEGAGTILQSPSGEWVRRQPATFFPLLERVSRVGDVSPILSKRWREAKSQLAKMELL